MFFFSCFVTQILVAIAGENSPVVNTNCGKIQGFNAKSLNGIPFSAFLNIPYAIPPVGDLRFTILVAICGENPPIVNIKSGKIQGFHAISYNNKNCYSAFLNIPYAIPPVGNLRFTYPQPFGKWNGTRIGNRSGNGCPQMSFDTGKFIGDDDCLNLNVYVPQCVDRSTELNLAVMVYFYGGGYSYGTNSFAEYNPNKYMDFPVILVIPNYRVAAFGFLSTNDSSAYGNYGMMDTVLALKWVRDNIQFFGGDPNRVTIFGNSAGSATVTHLVLSPLAKGLFTRAIDESGSTLSVWAVSPNPVQNAQSLAKNVNCPYNSTAELVNCLRTKTALEIVTGTRALQKTAFFPLPFAPVVEAPGGPGFLTKMPIDIIRQGEIANKVPMLIGQTQLEGYSFYGDLNLPFPYNGTGEDYFQSLFVPSILPLFTYVQPHMTDAINAIKNYYLKNLDLNNKTVLVHAYSELIGDAIISATNAQTADLFSKAGLPVYAFIYTYISQNMCFGSFFFEECGLYSSHADELFIQYTYFGNTNATNLDKQMTKVLNSLWVAFANHSDLYLSRGVLWPRYNTTKPRHAILNLQLTIGSGTLSNAINFWVDRIPDIINKYN